ncbi:protein of unknown function [Micropruina glycogenica]|uniref:Uncharacterized protein n=1 Tax=Micropruina glycogenica TaxID=75385 RepID=A0A2N9JAB3_9ACTN|nr:protein of unknown function [Micropruina glycogenica]
MVRLPHASHTHFLWTMRGARQQSTLWRIFVWFTGNGGPQCEGAFTPGMHVGEQASFIATRADEVD